MNSAIYETRKHRFNQYKNTLRKTITEAKKRYFSNQFGRYEGNGKKHGKQLIMPFIKNHVKQYLIQYLSIQN